VENRRVLGGWLARLSVLVPLGIVFARASLSMTTCLNAASARDTQGVAQLVGIERIEAVGYHEW
jgi:hypothetical protein